MSGVVGLCVVVGVAAAIGTRSVENDCVTIKTLGLRIEDNRVYGVDVTQFVIGLLANLGLKFASIID